MTDKDDLIDILSENESELGAMVGNQWEEIAELKAENERLAECCTRRGARMQLLYNGVMAAYNYETSGILWELIVKSNDWFDEDGVPVETTQR